MAFLRSALGPLVSVLFLGILFARNAVADEFSGCIPELGLSLSRLSSLKGGAWEGAGSMEVLDYDPFSKLAAVVEARRSATTPLALLIVNYANLAAPVIHKRILVSNSSNEGNVVGTPNSVAVWNGFAALTLDGPAFTDPGVLRIYHMASGSKVAELVMPGCSMPDSVKWTKDGKRLVIACEGEPVTQEVSGSDPNVDPNPSGAIGIVDVSIKSYTLADATCPTADFTFTYKRLDFQAYIDSLSSKTYENLLAKGFRIDPRLTKDTAAKDIEPEYVALHSDPKVHLAYVTLQENNGIAVIDLTPGRERIRTIWPLGLKSWATKVTDPSDTDGPKLRTVPGMYSWYQPDTIVHAIINRRCYLFIANEGDSKGESLRVKDLQLDPEVFGNVTFVKQENQLGRLTADALSGLKHGYDKSKPWNAQGPYNKVIAYGGRSWSIIDASTGKLVYESESHLEQTFISHPKASLCFNCDRERNLPDSRSDNSGPEPEALEVFEVEGRTYAAIGLERMGGLVLYDVSNPAAPVFGAYVYNRNFTAPSTTPTSALGDLAPEGIRFVPGSDSIDGGSFLLMTNEVSATVSAWRVSTCAQ